MQQITDALCVGALLLDCPQLRRERAWRRLQQRGKIDVIGAKAHAVFSQGCARRLIKALDLFGHFLAFKHAKRFNELKCHAARHAGDVLGGYQREQWRQQFLDMGLEPKVEPRLH